MLGRQNKDLILRLLKVSNDPTYHIIVTRSRSKGTARLDRIGSISPRATISMLKLDYKKLNKYLIEKNVTITPAVAKALNLDIMQIFDFKRYQRRHNIIRRLTGIASIRASTPAVCVACKNDNMSRISYAQELNSKLVQYHKNCTKTEKKKSLKVQYKKEGLTFERKIKNILKTLKIVYKKHKLKESRRVLKSHKSRKIRKIRKQRILKKGHKILRKNKYLKVIKKKNKNLQTISKRKENFRFDRILKRIVKRIIRYRQNRRKFTLSHKKPMSKALHLLDILEKHLNGLKIKRKRKIEIKRL